MDSFAEFAVQCPDEDIPLIRELMSYDALCEQSCTFKRNALGGLVQVVAPSPLHWSRQVEYPWALRNGELQCQHKVLDVGSGWSVFKFALSERVYYGSVTTTEINPDFAARAQQSINTVRNRGNIKQVIADARKMPFPDNSFDRVFSISVIEHIPDGHAQVLSECMRVLRPGGALILTMDVVIEGEVGNGDFYLSAEGSAALLQQLGVDLRRREGPVLGARVPVTNRSHEVVVAVILTRWVKGASNA